MHTVFCLYISMAFECSNVGYTNIFGLHLSLLLFTCVCSALIERYVISVHALIAFSITRWWKNIHYHLWPIGNILWQLIFKLLSGLGSKVSAIHDLCSFKRNDSWWRVCAVGVCQHQSKISRWLKRYWNSYWCLSTPSHIGWEKKASTWSGW